MNEHKGGPSPEHTAEHNEITEEQIEEEARRWVENNPDPKGLKDWIGLLENIQEGKFPEVKERLFSGWSAENIGSFIEITKSEAGNILEPQFAPGKPSEAEIESRVERMLGDLSMATISQYRETRNQIAAMAEGENPHGMRNEHYKGWEDEDFERLLESMKQKEDEMGVAF